MILLVLPQPLDNLVHNLWLAPMRSMSNAIWPSLVRFCTVMIAS